MKAHFYSLNRLVETGMLQEVERKHLWEAQIRNSRQLIKAWCDDSARQQLLETSAIPTQHLRQIVLCARFLLLRGPGSHRLPDLICCANAIPDEALIETLIRANDSKLLQICGTIIHDQSELVIMASVLNTMKRWLAVLLGLFLGIGIWIIYQERQLLTSAYVDPTLQVFSSFLAKQNFLWLTSSILGLSALCLLAMWFSTWLIIYLMQAGVPLVEFLMGICPRDEVIRQDALKHMNNNQLFVLNSPDWVMPGVLSLALGVYALGLPYFSIVILGIFAFSLPIFWGLIRLKLFHLAYSFLPLEWGEPARQRLAAPTLLKLFLAYGLVVVYIATLTGLINFSLNAWGLWTEQRIEALQINSSSWLESSRTPQEHLATQQSANQAVQNWRGEIAKTQSFFTDLVEIVMPLSRLGWLGGMFSLAVGWLIFVKPRVGTGKLLAGFTALFVLGEFAEDFLGSLFFGNFKPPNLSAGILVGYAWALGRELNDIYQEQKLPKECPGCFRLYIEDASYCSFCKTQRELQAVLPFPNDEERRRLHIPSSAWNQNLLWKTLYAVIKRFMVWKQKLDQKWTTKNKN